MTSMNRLINMKTDRIILLLFIPWILLFIVPFAPFYKSVEHAYNLLFVIVLIQIGLVFTFSYLTVKTLKDLSNTGNLKFSLMKFGIHTSINFCIISYLFLPMLQPERIEDFILLTTGLYFIFLLSELVRLRSISAYVVSLEQGRKAKFKEYVYTFILLTSIYGVWNIHTRIKKIISDTTTAPNNKKLNYHRR